MIILIGMPGAGKSAVGERVASLLGGSFRDLDTEIEARDGRSIPEIFAAEGEGGFRAREAAVLKIVLERDPPTVLATGGGAPCAADNGERLRAAGTVVYWRASVETLLQRTRGGGRSPIPRGYSEIRGCSAIRERTQLDELPRCHLRGVEEVNGPVGAARGEESAVRGEA